MVAERYHFQWAKLNITMAHMHNLTLWAELTLHMNW